MKKQKLTKDLKKWFQIQDGDLIAAKKYFSSDIDMFIADNGKQKGWDLQEYLSAIISFEELIRAFALKMKKNPKFERFDLDLIVKVTPKGKKK